MNVYDTQVWKGEEWVGFFLDDALAQAWVNDQSDPAAYTINKTTPREVRA